MESADDAPGTEAAAWDEKKTSLMASVLGQEADWVMHAIIPFEFGGSLDQYYFTSPKSGTAIATKELSLLPDQGSSNDRLTTYELVGFIRSPFTQEDANNPETPAGRIDCRLATFLNALARYSEQATLNRFETCAVPQGDEDEDYPLVIFDEYCRFEIGKERNFGLLAVIEILPSEFAFCQENGGEALIELLKADGVYPFTDPKRSPVI